MYLWIWQHLPGPTWARASQALALVLAAVAFCFMWGFPRLDRWVTGDPSMAPHGQTTVR